MPRAGYAVVMSVLLLGAMSASNVLAQCMLANPSFELAGSGGATFGGWNQFGSVGSSPDATHGAMAARVSGPSAGGWDVSAYWQRLDSAPGERWSASVRVWHSPARPLTGESRAIVNIEWRDEGGGLIDFESHTAADASTAPGEIEQWSIESGPAPAGTAATHILLGVLQAPNDPAPDVFYDQITFDTLGPPTLDERQWFDFPGGRTIDFSGRTWRVKGPGFYGPGPSQFCEDVSCTWVDAEGRLHLTIQNTTGSWTSTEVVLEEALGYGDYVFTTRGRLDDWHPNVVLGLFLWQYGACFDPAYGWWNPYNEVDIEFSRWGNSGNDVGQFVVQPYDFPGNLSGFDVDFVDDEQVSHAIRWLADRVEIRSWRGGPDDESTGTLIHSWTNVGPHIPRPEQPRVHINFWQFTAPPDTDHEVVIDAFTFVPEDPIVGLPSVASLLVPGIHLAAAVPNPFRPQAAIRYVLPEDGHARVVVYDASGRLVRTLVRRTLSAGDHQTVWDGRDDSGRVVASGVYLYQLRTGDVVETRSMVLVR